MRNQVGWVGGWLKAKENVLRERGEDGGLLLLRKVNRSGWLGRRSETERKGDREKEKERERGREIDKETRHMTMIEYKFIW